MSEIEAKQDSPSAIGRLKTWWSNVRQRDREQRLHESMGAHIGLALIWTIGLVLKLTRRPVDAASIALWGFAACFSWYRVWRRAQADRASR